ncbi:hypothetical protein [Aeoliella sp.]|uniref:hypothetical protein n=1 Tax=Aeoliella sp. TaxID=2795800 RepID=UPI003CCBCDD4
METSPPANQLDLSKYRTDALVDHLVELISVPGAIRKVVATAAVAGLLTAVACGLIRSYSELSTLPWLVVSAYSLAASVALGVLLGVLRVVRTALGNIQSLLGQGLEITRRAASDYQQLGAGELELPTGEELFEQVHSRVLMPAVERAVSRVFGFLASPLLWVYRRTIGSAVSLVIKRASRSPDVAAQHERIEQMTHSTLGQLSGYSDAVETFTTSASQVVERVGTRLRLFAMLPLWALFAVAAVLACAPAIVAVWLAQ